VELNSIATVVNNLPPDTGQGAVYLEGQLQSPADEINKYLKAPYFMETHQNIETGQLLSGQLVREDNLHHAICQ